MKILSHIAIGLILLWPPLSSGHHPPPCFRGVDFKNRVYPFREEGFAFGGQWIRVRDGRYEQPHKTPPNNMFLYFRIADVVFGDLTGDEQEEAAVITRYGSASGNYDLTDTYIFGCVGGRVRLMDILKQSRIARDHDVLMNEAVNRPVAIKKGVLYVTHYHYTLVEGKASHIATFGYKLVGQKLTPESFASKKRESI